MDSLASSGAMSSPQSSPSPSAPVSKKRVVKLAKDADEVLAQCHKLRDELRRKQMKRQSMEAGITNSNVSSDDGEWDMSSDDDKKKKKGASLKTDVTTTNTKSKTKTQQLSLAELNSKRSASGDNDDGKQTIVEVVEMNSTEVMEGIENVAIKIAHQVLNKQGFQLDIPCELYLYIVCLVIGLYCIHCNSEWYTNIIQLLFLEKKQSPCCFQSNLCARIG